MKMVGGNENEDAFYKPEEFCLAYYPPNQGNDPKDLILKFASCPPRPENWCEGLQGRVKTWGFVISIIFLLLTIFVYIAEDSLRYTSYQHIK